MKEWIGALCVLAIIFLLCVAFMKYGLPAIEKSMTTLQSHSARL